MRPNVPIAAYISAFASSPLAKFDGWTPWSLTAHSDALLEALLADLSTEEFTIIGEIALHRTAVVEGGAILKGPLIIGPGCFVAAGAYLRGGNWLAANCTIGPGAELKSSFVFSGTTLAHFNFVGDSILGEGVNLEAGSIVCNHRNERPNKEIRVRVGAELHGIGAEKFGALIGDGCRIGANAVLAPGALLPSGTVVGRGETLDQELRSARDDG
jgi:NDP-sugar pyrophosphorylase family protein